MSQSIWFLFRFFTPRVCELGLPLGTPWTPQKLDWMLSYFADCIQILVLAALSWADGWKSTAIRKITTEPIQVKLLLIVPIRCPNPQSSGVKNRSQQPNFFEIPNKGISYLGHLTRQYFRPRITEILIIQKIMAILAKYRVILSYTILSYRMAYEMPPCIISSWLMMRVRFFLIRR